MKQVSYKKLWHLLIDKSLKKNRFEKACRHQFLNLVPRDAIEANDYNISVSSYVEQADTREVIDIHALNKKIAEIVKREDELRKAIDAIVADLEAAKA